ncbi:MAG: hypothetical protein V1808_03205 [Candidatus Daviesbacteria bacterium]
MSKNGFVPIAIILLLTVTLLLGFFFIKNLSLLQQTSLIPNISKITRTVAPNKETNSSSVRVSDTPNKEITSFPARVSKLTPLGSGLSFDIVIKSAQAKVLGESTSSKKTIPVQIFAYEDHNGNGVREPDDQPIGFMPVKIYDSPFSDTPLQELNSNPPGWASALLQVGAPYQLVVIPVATKDYIPTTKPIILSEKNNFAVVGYQKKQEQTFHISVFAFEDANKDSNYYYNAHDSSKDEKPLFLAPFKFYQQKENGDWELLPNSVNSTDTGWATTSLSVQYPYLVKVEAGDLDNLTPSNKELILSNNNASLIFPYIAK